MKKFLYFLSGTNTRTLTQYPEDEYRQLSVGSVVLCTGLLVGFSGGYASSLVFGFSPMALVFGVLWGTVITSLVTAIISFLESSRGASKVFAIALATLLAFLVASVISIPFELKLFEAEINQRLISDSGGGPPGFQYRYQAFQELKATSPTLFWAHWAISTLFTVLTIAPILMKTLLLSGRNDVRSRSKDVPMALEAAAEQWLKRYQEDLHKQLLAELNARPEKVTGAHLIAALKKAGAMESGTYRELTPPDFASGFASAMDWFGDLAPTIEDFRGGKKTLDEARDAAIARDWAMIGQDLQKVLDKHGEEPAPPNA